MKPTGACALLLPNSSRAPGHETAMGVQSPMLKEGQSIVAQCYSTAHYTTRHTDDGRQVVTAVPAGGRLRLTVIRLGTAGHQFQSMPDDLLKIVKDRQIFKDRGGKTCQKLTTMIRRDVGVRSPDSRVNLTRHYCPFTDLERSKKFTPNIRLGRLSRVLIANMIPVFWVLADYHVCARTVRYRSKT